jgi:AcrR family transcriptional regulator
MATRGRGRPARDAPGVTDAAILDAALDAFADRGFEGTSLRELARDLGISHNLIPQRFGTKEQVWYRAVDHGFGALASDLLGVIADPPEGELEALRAMVVRFVEANAARPALLRIINQEAVAPGPRLDHLFEAYIDPVREFGEWLLALLAERGEVRTRSVGLVYFLMTHGAGGPFALPALSDRFGPAPSAQEAVDVLFDGLVRK